MSRFLRPTVNRTTQWSALTSMLALLLSTSCRRSNGVPDEKLGGLVVAPVVTEKAVSLDAAAKDPMELLRALQAPLVAGKAGAKSVRFKESGSSIVSEAGAVVDKIDDESMIEIADSGSWHALYNNSGDNGRESIFDGKQLYLKPRYMRWHGRAPNDAEEPSQLLASYGQQVAADFDLLLPGAELIDGGVVQVAGRAARKISAKLAPSPRAATPETLPQRQWRSSRKVTAVDGEFVFDAETSLLLSAKIAGAVDFTREQRSFSMKVTVQRSSESTGSTFVISAPQASDVVATPERAREVDERDALLDGIAPSSRRVIAAPSIGAEPGSTISPPSPGKTVKKPAVMDQP
jgi:hypothetical protein